MKSLSRRWCHGAPLWLLLLALFPSTVHCQTSNEKFILSRFYDVAGGPNWINNTGWKNANVPICSWFGILCLGKPSDTHGVSGINLPGNNLQGRIAKLIYTLPQLRTVNVQKNPGITNAGFDGFETKHPQNFLQKLLFAQCSLTALTGLENAPSSLTELHLTGNQLKSNFPTEILNVTSLQILYLSYNKIKGTLPTQIGGLTNLQELFLYQTAMTGQLPTQLGKLNKLTIFTVAENLLSGTLPTELNQMSSMKTLSFHNNGVNVGSIGGPLIDFSGLPMLSELYLDGNDLTGTIPSTFLKNNVNTDTRVAVGLSNNKLTGALPLTLNRFQLLDIDLVGNSISLIPVSFCNNKGWMSGLVELFGCNAIMCEVGTYNDFGVQLSAESPCLICNQPATDFWGSTSCGVTSNNSTAAPSSSGSSSSSSLSSLDVRTILGTFYQDLTGTLWLNQTGWDQIGTLLKTFQVSDLARVSNFTAASVCSWLGVTCDTSNNVIEISLPRNGLVGTIPTEIGDLTKLQLLNVAGNQAVTIKKKEFWTAIGSTNIKTLNLADTNINNLVGIGAVTQLQALTLDGVYFAGTLPTDLFQLMNLKSLHMQYNVLTGTLPTLIGQLSKLQVYVLPALLEIGYGGIYPLIFSHFACLSQIEFIRQRTKGVFTKPAGFSHQVNHS
jgi:Leucine-rich repeat (LRR) protein